MAEYSTFRRTAWDPILIVAQIVTLQCFGYSTFSVLMAFASVLTELRLGPQLLFDGRLVRGDTVEGWVVGVGLLSMGAANILPLVYMVERSRLCVDFSLTFFAVHLILVWWHQGTPPLTLLWWAAVGASGALMAVGGRAACLRRELLPIAIRSYMPMRPPEAHSDHGGPAGAEEHELETRRPEAPAMEVL
ncbi:Integral membrane protein of the Golgi, partial [Coemansia biformis]